MDLSLIQTSNFQGLMPCLALSQRLSDALLIKLTCPWLLFPVYQRRKQTFMSTALLYFTSVKCFSLLILCHHSRVLRYYFLHYPPQACISMTEIMIIVDHFHKWQHIYSFVIMLIRLTGLILVSYSFGFFP